MAGPMDVPRAIDWQKAQGLGLKLQKENKLL
jgi:hypothetical protein